jgi:hypothetical protein
VFQPAGECLLHGFSVENLDLVTLLRNSYKNTEIELAKRNAVATAVDSPQPDASASTASRASPSLVASKPLNTTSLPFAALRTWLRSLFEKSG